MAIRIGELLVQDGVLTPEQVEKALTAQKIYGGRLGTNLIEQGFVTEHQVAAALSRQLGIPLVDSDRLTTIRPEVKASIPREVVERFRVLPFDCSPDGKEVSLASAEPHVDWGVFPRVCAATLARAPRSPRTTAACPSRAATCRSIWTLYGVEEGPIERICCTQ